jgi:phosphate-selective porin OprO/OprP
LPPGAAASNGGPPATPKRDWNEFDFGFTTLRVGGVLLLEMATYSQDDDSEAQVDLEPAGVMRDGRFLFRGRFAIDWPVTWQTGIMYEEATRSWRFRQTGIIAKLPGSWGAVFLGRTKEGVSANKILVGTYGWTMERFPFSDATLPILADGVRWFGHLPDKHLIWHLGFYHDWQSEVETFSKDEHQIAARAVWVSQPADSSGVLHLGLNGRWAKPDDDRLRLRSRPESFSAPFVIDTETFPATSTVMVGPEIYYQRGGWLLGSEYYVLRAASAEADDPIFHGGDVFVSRLLNGATRAYNLGTFGNVIPTDPLFDGGPGAFEVVLRFSYTDLNGGTLEGGTFWRVTPMVNWHINENLRFEFAYGYGVLDRFDLQGATRFFQSRIQFQL